MSSSCLDDAVDLERVRVKRYYEHVFTKSELALGVSDTMGGGDLEGLVSRGPSPPKLGAVVVCLGGARCVDLVVVLVGIEGRCPLQLPSCLLHPVLPPSPSLLFSLSQCRLLLS